MKQTIREWLDTPCDNSEISTLDGAFYLPIHVVLWKLQKMRELFNADANIITPRHQYYRLANGDDICSGNLQVSVVCHSEGFNMQCPGAATILLKQYSDNHHYAETVKSLCIVNACKMLGRQFGSHLNEMLDVERQAQEKQKPKLDALMKEKYATAIVNNDVVTIKAMEESYDVRP
jgi:hypothetical protein